MSFEYEPGMNIVNFKITRPDITQDLKKGKLTDNKRSILLKKGQLRLNSLPRNAMQKVNIRLMDTTTHGNMGLLSNAEVSVFIKENVKEGDE